MHLAHIKSRRSRSFRTTRPRARRTRLRRPVSIEVLEDRTLLTSGSLTPVLGSGADLAVDLQLSQQPERPTTAHEQDFYWSNGQQVRLQRLTDEQILRFAPATDVDALLDSLTSSGDALDGWAVSHFLDHDTVVMRHVSAGQAGTSETFNPFSSVPEVQWSAPVFVTAGGGAKVTVTDEIIVALRPGVDPAHFFAGGYTGFQRIAGTPDQYVATVQSGGPLAVLALADSLRSDPQVGFASPNMYTDLRTALIPNDPLFGGQWHLHNTGQTGGTADADPDLPEAWDTTTGDGDITIAVLDDGVQTNHPDLSIFINGGETAGNGVDDDGNGWIDDVNGWDFRNGDNDPNPGSALDNHGTAMAGIAGAVGDNSTGVSGAAQGVRIMPVKIARNGIFGNSATIASGIYYAAGRTENGSGTWNSADILSNSWVGGAPDATVTAAFDWASTNGRGGLGAASFAAAGNSASGYRQFSLGVGGGNWLFEWRYEKNDELVSGADTVWLGNVRFPEGSTERFDSLGLPTGWTSFGSAPWSVVDDPAHTYGTGRYAAKAGTIGHSQVSTLRSPTFSVPAAASLTFDYWTSSEDESDPLFVYASDDGGGSYNGPFLVGSGVPTTASNASYPASLASTIAVGASTDFDYRSDYSQYGSALDFVAPSSGGFEGITTTDRTGTSGYNTASGPAGDYNNTPASALGGTSSATALAAGVAALLLSKNPNLTAAEIRQTMRDTSDKIGSVPYTSGINTYYGHGRINADAALAAVPGPTVAASVTGHVLNGGSSNRSGLAKLAFQFSEAVTIDAAGSLVFWNHTSAAAVDVSGAALENNGSNAVTWNLSGISLPDGYYTATLPQAAAGLLATHTILFSILAGDSTGDGQVGFGDFGDLAGSFNTVGGAAYGPGDMDGNGDVNFSDFGILASSFNNALTVPGMDFGDASETATSFPTTLANNGARHILGSGLFLGAAVDPEADGQPNATATGDGSDEDGVTFATLQAGTNAAITVVASVPGTAVLNAWIDFTGDGDWDDAGEQVVIDQPVTTGANNLMVPIPGGSTLGAKFARFRVASAAGYTDSDLAYDGEVEDYLVNITAAARAPKVKGPVGLLTVWDARASNDQSRGRRESATPAPIQGDVNADAVDLAIQEAATSRPLRPALHEGPSLLDESVVDEAFGDTPVLGAILEARLFEKAGLLAQPRSGGKK